MPYLTRTFSLLNIIHFYIDSEEKLYYKFFFTDKPRLLRTRKG